MHTYYKKTFIALGAFAVLALVVMLVFYDAIAPVRLTSPLTQKNVPGENPSAKNNDQLFQDLDADLSDLDAKYNFNTPPEADSLAAPNFGDELTTLSQ